MMVERSSNEDTGRYKGDVVRTQEGRKKVQKRHWRVDWRCSEDTGGLKGGVVM